MLGPQLAALGEAAAGEDVAVRRSHVAFVRPVFSYAIYEGFYREDVLVWELRGTVPRPICGVHPMEHFPGLIEYSLGRPITEVMEQMYETNPEEAAKYVFVSKMPGEASWKTDAQRAAEAAASSSQHLRK